MQIDPSGPRLLNLAEVLQLHLWVIEEWGGNPGTRDQKVLQSALAMPQASSGGEYLHSDLFAMAAAYLFYIVRDRPFVDGNRRLAAAAALVFLEMNGIEVRTTNPALVRAVFNVAEDKLSKAGVAELLRKTGRPRTERPPGH